MRQAVEARQCRIANDDEIATYSREPPEAAKVAQIVVGCDEE